MKPNEFARLMARDNGCIHCGEFEAVSPNHRINRGMGGSKLLDRPSNLVVLCSRLNLLIESDPHWMKIGKEHGWKLERWQIPEETPVFDVRSGFWLLLDNNYGYVTV